MPTKTEEALLLAIQSVRATRDVIETNTQRAKQVLRDVLIEAGRRSLRGRREPVEKYAVGPKGEKLYITIRHRHALATVFLNEEFRIIHPGGKPILSKHSNVKLDNELLSSLDVLNAQRT